MRAGTCCAGLLMVALACAGCQGQTRRLLQQGRWQQLLDTVRPVDADAYWLRSCAQWRLGRAREARQEALLGLSAAPRSARGHRMLGSLEAHMDRRGAALTHLQRSLELKPDQPKVRQAVARLLLARARLRRSPAMGGHQQKQARDDARQALSIDPTIRDQACEAEREAAKPTPPTARCPGPPSSSLRTPRSALRAPGRRPGLVLQRLQRQDLLLHCRGVQAARRLERAGSLPQAGTIWAALMQEAPTDPRWPLARARNLLLQALPARAEALLQGHVYLSTDRVAALQRAAQVLLLTGHPRRAGRKAVESLAFAETPRHYADAERLLRRCELPKQAAQTAALARQRFGQRSRP